LHRADIIKVHDGRSITSPVITVICNELTEMEILSSGSDLYIEFIGNSNWPGQGFKASFQFQRFGSLKETPPSGKFFKAFLCPELRS